MCRAIRPGRVTVAILAVTGLLIGPTPVRADEPTPRELIDRVAKRLLAVVDPPANMEWPPTFVLVKADQINAYAGVRLGPGEDAEKVLPRVAVTTAMMEKVVQGDEDRLAFIVGHELSHLALGHCTRPRKGSTEFVQDVFGRQHELDADLCGMGYALKAGYSQRRAVAGIRRMVELGLEYNSFEGLRSDHPSWKERLAYIDKGQAALWRAMSGFDTGAYFLMFEQYAAAERCFREVVREFPGCAEAWTNLGYAQLMQYCDALDPDDLRAFGIGQLVVGGFYRRPVSLETQVRGINEELWWDAVGSLREAIRVDPEASLARADLGVAYLLRPGGRQVGQARKFLDDAANRARADKSLHPLTRASIILNAGVADVAAEDVKAAAKKYDEAEAIGRQLTAGPTRPPSPLALNASLRYNRALILSASSDPEERLAAVKHFERYLAAVSPSSAWWSLAYDRYARLCRELGRKAKPRAELAEHVRTPFRLVTGLTVADGEEVFLNQPLKEARRLLGPGREVPVVKNTKIVRVKYPARGIELIATENVLAICLSGPNAPALSLRPVGVGTRPKAIKVGMSRKEVETLLGEQEYDFREIDREGQAYRFYPDLGVAIRIRQGVVEELAIVQIPRRAAVGQ